MPFPLLHNLLRRQRKPQPTPSPPSPISPTPRTQRRPTTPLIWCTTAQVFTGVSDASWYDDVLDSMVAESVASQCRESCSEEETGLESEEAEVVFDADVWVELARAEEQGARLRRRRRHQRRRRSIPCAGLCRGREGYYYADVQELQYLTEAFVGHYYDGECTCLDVMAQGSMCLPGENFLKGARMVGDDEESVVSETESAFDHLDEVVRDVLWADAGGFTGEYGMFDEPPTPWSMASHASEYDEDAVVVLGVLEADEALRSDLPVQLYCFDADTQQYFGYTAFNQLLACP